MFWAICRRICAGRAVIDQVHDGALILAAMPVCGSE
jgi:hypothetical protein